MPITYNDHFYFNESRSDKQTHGAASMFISSNENGKYTARRYDGDIETTIACKRLRLPDGHSEIERDPNISEFTGHVCSVSLYKIWKMSDPKDDNIHVLSAILIRRYNSDTPYTIEYVTVFFSSTEIMTEWDLPSNVSALYVAAMANETTIHAGRSMTAPLSTIGQPTIWKSLYCTSLKMVKRKLGFERYYVPLRFTKNTSTGLLMSTSPLQNTTADKFPKYVSSKPFPGILNIFTYKDRNPEARDVRYANGANTEYESVTASHKNWIDNPQLRHNASKFQILTKTESTVVNGSQHGSTKRTLKSHVSSARIKLQMLSTEDGPIAQACDNIIRLSINGKDTDIIVRFPAPLAFDCLITESASFCSKSIALFYEKWYSELYEFTSVHQTGAKLLKPIFTYIGPELYPHGNDKDYAFFPGFPGWQILKLESACSNSIRTATEIYQQTDGLWPMAGSKTIAMLSPSKPAISIPQQLSSITVNGKSLMELFEQWPSGRIKCAFPSCTTITNAIVVKMDFSAFLPTLFTRAYPENIRLAQMVGDRLTKRDLWLKQPLVEFCGNEKKHRPDVYDAIIMLANGIAEIVESEAAREDFGICCFVRDGFWGAFTSTDGDPERLRHRLETVSNEFLSTCMGQSPYRNVKLSLRIEGVFKHAISWNANCYYLTDGKTDGLFNFSGFPTKNNFAVEGRNNMISILERFITGELSTPETIKAATTKCCQDLMEIAYINRGNCHFWYDRADLKMKHRDRKPLDIITTDGRLTTSEYSSCNDQMIVPAIYCENYVKMVLCTIFRLTDSLIYSITVPDDSNTHTQRSPTERSDSMWDSYAFLFIVNK